MLTTMNMPYQLPENQDPLKNKYVILEGIQERNRFITTNEHPNNIYAYGDNKRQAFNILGYANTIAEAQMFMYGQVTTKSKD